MSRHQAHPQGHTPAHIAPRAHTHAHATHVQAERGSAPPTAPLSRPQPQPQPQPGQSGQRWVMHADLDAFFAAAEVLRRPDLRNVPLVVGGSAQGRGVVSTASYAARIYGVRSAMPMATALRLCPGLVVLPPDFRYYRDLAHRFRAILERYSPLIEVVSVDEAYLDTSGSERLFGGALELARSLKAAVLHETGLVVSLGVAANKLVAKIASDLDKPDGLRIVAPGTEAATLAPLAIDRLPGIGPKSAAHLRSWGIETLGDLVIAPDHVLRSTGGGGSTDVERIRRLRQRAAGVDLRPVVPAWEREERKSLGHETTFATDRRGLAELDATLLRLCEETAAALRSEQFTAATVCIKVRYHDFGTITRQQPLLHATDAQQELYRVTRTLLQRALAERNAPVRLLGVRTTGLSRTRQLSLFEHVASDPQARTRRVNGALDAVTARAGRDAMHLGRRMALETRTPPC